MTQNEKEGKKIIIIQRWSRAAEAWVDYEKADSELEASRKLAETQRYTEARIKK